MSACKLSLDERIERFRRRAMARALKSAAGSLATAAMSLGITERQMRYGAKLYGIAFQDWRAHNMTPLEHRAVSGQMREYLRRTAR